MRAFWKYSGGFIVAEFLAIAAIWLMSILFSPALDRLFELMVYFYWPAILLVNLIVKLGGGSAMYVAIVFGIAIGIIIYGIIFGAAANFLKKSRLM